MSGKDCICYYSANVDQFLDPNPELKWLQLLPDLAVGKVKDSHKAGVISVKIHLKDVTAIPDDQLKTASIEVAKKKKRYDVKIIHAYIF
jgi:hypothetical protein